VKLVAKSERSDAPVACTLSDAGQLNQRLDDWRQLLAQATNREPIDGGLRLRFPSGAEVATDVARLAAAEVGCCGWIDFTIAVRADATLLDVQAGPDGYAVLLSMFGAPA
jgi:hypothetical protein